MTAHPSSDDRRSQVRALIAEVVHDAVCTFSQSDGFALCQLYTVAGYALLGRIDGPQWTMQAGSAWMLADPPDGWWYYDATTPLALERGEFHCWLAKEGATKGGPPAQFADFSARHFHRTVDTMCASGAMNGGEVIPWTHRAEPPPYVWTDGLQSEWVRWEPSPAMCRALWTTVLDRMEQYRPLMRLVADRYRAGVREFQRQ
jgi:hypothetical protein